MKKKMLYGMMFMLFFFLWFLFPMEASAAEEKQEENYLNETWKELDFGDIDQFTQRQEGISFSDVVQELMENGIDGFEKETLFNWIKDTLTLEITENKKLLIEVVLLAFFFSLLKNFAGVFQASYISNLCFLLVYCVLAVMLLHSFSSFQGIVETALEKSVDFMKVLVPTFCISMLFSSNVSSAIGFYQIAFLVIYLIEWLFLNILMPMIRIYVLMEIFGHFLEEERFSNLTELFYQMIGWGIKISGIAVLGLNVVQNLVNPAKDRLNQGIFARAASAVPGVGNAVNSVSELLLGSGIVIKNCIGAAGFLVLVFIMMIPLVKVGCLTFFYKISAAVTEPVTDKRIVGCLKGLANGGVLYLKLLSYGLLLFLLTIALTATASSYIY